MRTKRFKLLKETVDYYSVNPRERRCATQYYCRYSPSTLNKPNSSGCAVGRLVSNELKLKLDAYNGGTGGTSRQIFHLLPLDIKQYGVNFLRDLQCLHDDDDFWDDKGLTKFGRTQVEIIRNNIITRYND